MLEIYFKTLREEEIKKIDEIKPGCWIHVNEATAEDLQKIIEITGLEMSDLQDSLDKYEIPRIENKNSNVLIFVRHPAEYEAGLHTETLTLILTPSYFITISPHKSQLVHSMISYKLKLQATTQRSNLLLLILLKITQDFTYNIKVVRSHVIEEGQHVKNISHATIMELTKNEEMLNQYLSALVPMTTVLEAITSGRFINLYEKDQDLLQDLVIAIKQSADICQVNIKNIRSLRDAYQIIFTNDVNKTIKLLTAITIVFTIPTIIASFYGMNVALPFEKNPFAFLFILIFTLILMVFSVYLFARKKWL
jgi:magnesium transporter